MVASRYQNLFASVPVSLWEEDFSGVRTELERLRQRGVKDFSVYFEENPDEVIRCATLVQIKDVNQQTLKLYRASSKEELLTSLDKVFTPESLPIFASELVALAAGKTELSCRGQNRRLDGTPIWVEVRASLPADSRETWETVHVAIIDVTDQHLTEIQYRQSEDRYRQFQQDAPLPYQALDEKGCFIEVNKSFEQLVGYRNDELIGRQFSDLLPQNQKAKFQRNFKELLRRGEVIGAEFTLQSKSGENFEVVINGKISQDRIGHLERTHCLLFNLTERKQAEDELKRRETSYRRLYEQFRTLFEGISDAIIIVTVDERVSWGNPTAAAICNLTMEQLIGQTGSRLEQEHNFPFAADLLHQAFTSGTTCNGLIDSEDGRSWGLRIFPLSNSLGEVNEAMLLAHDITDKIKLQAETLRTGQLASLGELAAGVAHEINNPINGIINYAQILINKAQQGNENHDIATHIRDEGDRIARIVSSLLSFSRQKSESKRAVDLHELIDDVLTLCQAQLNAEGIRTTVELPKAMPLIYARKQQIEQVLINLISNARYALKEKFPQSKSTGKELRIAAQSRREQNLLLLTIYDNGCGIPVEIRDRILNPFFSTKPQGSGTGLGLSISHGIIQDHGGTLHLESQPGEFTRFTLELPTAS